MRHLRAAIRSLGHLRTWREILLTVGAVLGVVCIAAAIATVGFGVKPLVFRSGSMSPAITTGSLAFARTVPAEALKIGDIVSVKDAQGVRITHRIVAIDVGDGQATLTLRGDANNVADASAYVVRSADRVGFSVPGAGYVVGWVSGPVGTFAGGIFVALILVVAFRRPGGGRRRGPPSGGPDQSGESGAGGAPNPGRPAGARRQAVASVLALVLGAGLLGGTTANPVLPTLATWVNAATAGSTFTTYTVPKPVIGCVQSGNVLIGYTLTMSWPAVSSPYPVTYTARIVQNNRIIAVPATGATRSIQITSGLFASIVGDTATLEVTAALTASPTWNVLGNHDFTTGLLGLTFDCKGASY